MPVDVTIFLGPGVSDLVGAAMKAGKAQVTVAPYDLAKVTAAIGAKAQVAVIWQGLAVALAQAVQQGSLPSAALTQWQTTTSDLLALFRRNRRAMFLVDEDLFDRGTIEERTRLRDRLQLPKVPGANLGTNDALTEVLGRLAATQLASVRGLVEEFQASSLSPQPFALKPTHLDSAAAILSAMTEAQAEIQAEAEATVAELTATVELLRAGQTVNQPKVGTEASGKVAVLRDGATPAAEAQNKDTQIGTDEKQDEIALLRALIRQLQQQLDEERASGGKTVATDLYADRQLALALASQRAEAEARAELEQDLREVRSQLARQRRHETDLMAALATIRTLTKDNADLLGTIADQAATLSQGKGTAEKLTAAVDALHAREAALKAEAEGAQARMKGLEEQLASARERGEALEAEFEAALARAREMEELLDAARHREAALDGAVRGLEAEQARIYDSRSWKVTEPLRSASRIIRPRKGNP